MTVSIQTHRTAPRRKIVQQRCQRAAVLLEVLLSMGLLIFALGMVGSQIVSAMSLAERNDQDTRTAMMLDLIMSELNSRKIRLAEVGDEMPDSEVSGSFGIRFPGYTWQIETFDTDVDGVYQLLLELGYSEDDYEQQIDTPDYEASFDDNDKVVASTRRLWTMPAKIDLARDYGLEADDLTKLLGALGAAGAMSGFDETSGDGGGGGMFPGVPNAGNGDGDAGGGMDGMGDVLPGEMPAGFEAIQAFLPEGVDAEELFELLTREGGFDPTEIIDILGEGSGDFAGKIQELLGERGIRDLMRGDFLDNLQDVMNGAPVNTGRGGRDGRPGRGGREGRGGRDGEESGRGNRRPDRGGDNAGQDDNGDTAVDENNPGQ